MNQINNLRGFWYQSITVGYRSITPIRGQVIEKSRKCPVPKYHTRRHLPTGFIHRFVGNFSPRLLG